MIFRAGQDVICVNSDGWENSDTGEDSDGPLKGDELVVTATSWSWMFRQYLRFANWPGGEFEATSFRPLVKRSTSISIFTRMLDKAPKREVENV